MRGDQKARYESYAVARNWGWLSVNDIRDLENLNPVEGGRHLPTAFKYGAESGRTILT